MKISDKGLAFVRLHEGLVTRAYRDSVGVLTIGEGFTMRSAIFAAYWRKTRGHDLQSGDTITKEECDTLVGQMMAGEYATNVDSKAKPTTQAQYDACCSISWNCGPGSLSDGWARLLAGGDVAGAAAAVRVYKLTGGILRNRRADEARLMESGDYGQIDMSVHGTAAAPSVSQSVAEVRTYQQQLAALGLYEGPIDGIADSSRAAVVLFQGRNQLLVDGIVGPATRATILRELAAQPTVVSTSKGPMPPSSPASTTAAAGGALVVACGGAAAVAGVSWAWIGLVAVGAVVAIGIAFLVIKAKKG